MTVTFSFSIILFTLSEIFVIFIRFFLFYQNILYICIDFQIENRDKYTQKMKMIVVKHGDRERIMKAMSVSYPTVRRALRYETDHETAKKIRAYALRSLGGKVMEC